MQRPQTSSAWLREAFGLTEAEITVAARLAVGTGGLKSIAASLGVSVSTIRTHLQRAFDKTGTHRQAELVRLLLTHESGLGV